jgi:outer membrane protein
MKVAGMVFRNLKVSRGLTSILVVASGALVPAPAMAQDAQRSQGAQEPRRLDARVLSHAAPAFPLIWKPYRPLALPPVDLRNGSLAERIAGGTLRLSAHDFLQLVVENDLDLHAARYDYAIAQVDVLRAESGQAARGTPSSPLPAALFAGAIGAGISSTAALSPGGTGGAAISTQGKIVTIGPRGNFDPTLSLNLSYDRLVSPLNTTKVSGAAAVTVPSTVLQTRFQQELPYGTSYSVSFNLQKQSSTQGGLLFNPALSSFFALQVYQPLLNGFGLALNRRFVTLADNDRKIVVEAFHTTTNNTLSSAANAYWDLIALRETVKVAEESVAAAEQQYNDDRQRVELETMAPLDLLAAESQLAQSRVSLVTARTQLEQQEALIRTLISKTGDPALDAAVIEPTDALPGADAREIPTLAASIARAVADRSSVRQAVLGLQNQRIAEHYTGKNLLPTLSVYAALDAYGLAPGTSPAVRQLFHSAYPEYSLGLTLSVPVFNRSAQADDVRARLEAQQADAALRRTKSQIETQVQSATVSLTQGRAQIAAAQRAAVSSAAAFDGEKAKLEAGISTPYQVTLAQRDYVGAQSAEIQARVNYAKALVAYDLAVGGLLDRYGIAFQDALRGTLLADSRRR